VPLEVNARELWSRRVVEQRNYVFGFLPPRAYPRVFVAQSKGRPTFGKTKRDIFKPTA